MLSKSMANCFHFTLRNSPVHSKYIVSIASRVYYSTKLGPAIVSGAIVSGAIVSGAIVSEAIVSGAIVSGAIVSRAIVSGAIVSRACLVRVGRGLPCRRWWR